MDTTRSRDPIWVCTRDGCDGLLEPVVEDEEPPDDWWENPSKYADKPEVECTKCDQRYDMKPQPQVACPECGTGLNHREDDVYKCPGCTTAYQLTDDFEPVDLWDDLDFDEE